MRCCPVPFVRCPICQVAYIAREVYKLSLKVASADRGCRKESISALTCPRAGGLEGRMLQQVSEEVADSLWAKRLPGAKSM
jgi:hypothetical protein